MAHEITSADRFGETRVGGKKAWHGLGIEIPEGLTARQGFGNIGLGWNTELIVPEVTYTPSNGEKVIIRDPNFRMHVRCDTQESLGIVDKDYRVVSNQLMAEFADNLAGVDKAIRLETAGSLRRGKRVFACIRLPRDVEVVQDDVLNMFVVLSNGHDGLSGFNIYGSSVRVVCANTLAWSERELYRGVSFAHTGDVEVKLEAARAALGILVKNAGKFEEEIKTMARKHWTKTEIDGYFNAVYDRLFGVIPDDLDQKEKDRRTEHKNRTLGSWQALLQNERQTIKGIEESAWAAYNAVSEWSDHERGRFGEVTESEARVHSNLFGASHLDKRKAFVMAKSLALA